jgi:hypothetical protein
MTIEMTEQGVLALEFINRTERPIFLTGKAGTGKTTLLKQIINQTHKHAVVVAPTGIAALNAGGVTLHSMFQIPLESFIPQDVWVENHDNQFFVTPRTLRNHQRMSGEKQRVIRMMEVLIIDEVSMLRADLLDMVELTMRRIRGNNLPFGGVQVVFIGDLMQLPPVVKPNDLKILAKFYKSAYFFHATCLDKNPPLYIELKKIFRQADNVFIDFLNRLRNNGLTQEDSAFLQKYYQPNFQLNEQKGVILLTTHNYKASKVNEESMKALKTPSFTYNAIIKGDFPDKIYPVDVAMELKVGTQVMFTRNDNSFEKRFYNGKIGIVEYLDAVTIKVRTNDDNKLIEVEQQDWENNKYTINEQTKQVQSEVIGTFVQFPLRLAWAITIHKSQGLTFSKAALDVGDIFQSGQAYVAFSRLQSIQGLILLSAPDISKQDHDELVISYGSQNLGISAIKEELEQASQHYIRKLLKTSFDINEIYKQWLKHERSFFQGKDDQSKSSFLSWARSLGEKIKPLLEVSDNFHKYVDKKFHPESYDILIQKTQNARDYYIKALEEISEELIIQLALLEKRKKSKSYFNELYVFEEHFLSFIQRIHNCVLLTEAFFKGNKMEKNILDTQFIRSFRERMFERAKDKIQKHSRENLLDSTSDTLVDYSTRNQKSKLTPKEGKISTGELSFNLLKAGKSIEQICTERMLTRSTVEGHLAQMVKLGKLEAEELVDKDKISKIEETIKSNPSLEGLIAYKQILGDDFSFGEIKIVLARPTKKD